MNSTIFERKIKPFLLYVGTIGACIMAIAYVITVVVLIVGFKATTIRQMIVFACVNAVSGFGVMEMFRVQGQSFASNLEENKAIISEYYNTLTKDKKNHSMKWFWTMSILKDILSKMITVGLSTAGVLYLVIEGTKDFTLLLLGVVNLLMFICFGLTALSSTYDYYNLTFVPYMKEKIKEIKGAEDDKN